MPPDGDRSSTARDRLADRLTDLKRRRGVSYEAIAARAGLSRSSVHRYCTGAQVPAEFGAVERIAKACGADRAELVALHRLWLDASTPPPAAPAHAAPAEEPSTPPEPVAAGAVSEPGTPPNARRRPRHARIAALAIAGIVLAAVAASATSVPRATPPTLVPPGVWGDSPQPVPPSFFGVTLSSRSGAMPSFTVGAVRLWDSNTRWAEVEPRRGVFDWSTLDRLVAAANAAGLPVLFVFGGTPEWADPGGPVGPYADRSRTSPARQLADYDRYVTAVVSRYRSRIAAYQLWSIGDDVRFYSGRQAVLAEMMRRGARIVAELDPRATTVCAARTHLDTDGGRSMLADYVAAGGYQDCRVAAVNLYPPTPADPPEAMLVLAATVGQAFHAVGVQPLLWSTGTAYDVGAAPPLDPTVARNHAARFFLVGLYARLDRMYFYAWGSSSLPVTLQEEGAAPTPAAEAVATVQRWLAGASVRSCGHGAAAQLPDNAYRCLFSDAGGRPFAIAWTDVGDASMPATTAVEVDALSGPPQRVDAGGAIALSGAPVLVRPTG